jgi:hypothetical protein
MSDYKLCNIVDSQLEDITSELTLPVITGSNSNTYQQFNAQGGTGNTNIQFNVTVPSLATCVNRHVMLQTTIDLLVELEGGTTPGYWKKNQVLFSYGYTNSLQAFPLNSLIATVQGQINNAQIGVVTRDIMPALMKMYNYEELAKYNSLTPSLVDSFYQNYADGIGTNNNVIANYSVGGFSKVFQPRGCFPVELRNNDAEKTPFAGLNITANADGTSPLSKFIIRFTTTEPLLFLSPFISGNSNNNASLLGINNLILTLNLGDATRSMSNASYAIPVGGTDSVHTITNVSLSSVANSKLLFNFLDIPPQMGSKIEPKNVVNYNNYMSYNYNSSQEIPTKTSKVLTFNNVQLGSVPSKILIFCKKPTLTTYDSNYFLTIKSLTMNFANRSGLLSSATQADLYNMSVKNGLQMNFYEFSGQGVSNTPTGYPTVVPTIGSIICIDPAIDLSIPPQYQYE